MGERDAREHAGGVGVSSGLRNQIFARLELRLGLHGEARES